MVGERGSSALEFALVLPAVVLLFLGFLSTATYMVTRYHVSSAASFAARACTTPPPPVPPGPGAGCADAQVAAYLNAVNMASRCAGGPTVAAATQALPGTGVWIYRVDVSCNFTDNFAGRFLAGQGIQLARIFARGEMPIRQ